MCFAKDRVVRYKDYIDADLPAAVRDSLVTERTTWQGLDPRRAAMSDEAILDVAWDMLQALTYLHGRGVVHGDVRLQNILRVPVPAASSSFSSSSASSRSGRRPRGQRREIYKLIGHGLVPDVIDDFRFPPPAYIAPELRRRRAGGGPYKPTTRSDVWMLGWALCELHAYGRPGGIPGSGSRSSVFTEGVTGMEFDGLLRWEGRCDAHRHNRLDELLRMLLATRPGKRFTAANAIEWFAARRFADDEGGTLEDELGGVRDAVETARRERRRRRARAVGRVWARLRRELFALFVLFFALVLRNL